MFIYITIGIVALLVLSAIISENRTPSISSNSSQLSLNNITSNQSVISRRRAPSFDCRVQNRDGIWGWFENGIWVQDIVQDMLDEVEYMALFDDDGILISDTMDSHDSIDSDMYSGDFTTETDNRAFSRSTTLIPSVDASMSHNNTGKFD